MTHKSTVYYSLSACSIYQLHEVITLLHLHPNTFLNPSLCAGVNHSGNSTSHSTIESSLYTHTSPPPPFPKSTTQFEPVSKTLSFQIGRPSPLTLVSVPGLIMPAEGRETVRVQSSKVVILWVDFVVGPVYMEKHQCQPRDAKEKHIGRFMHQSLD